MSDKFIDYFNLYIFKPRLHRCCIVQMQSLMYLIIAKKQRIQFFDPPFWQKMFHPDCIKFWESLSPFSLLQLDANLIEGEPFNRFMQKNKRRLNVAQQNSNISEIWETGSKTRQNEQRQCRVQCSVVDTKIFSCPITHPWVKKHHSLTFKHKIRSSANNTDGIGTGYTSHDKEICLHWKRLQKTSKTNQSN